jgi:hypothetical protein
MKLCKLIPFLLLLSISQNTTAGIGSITEQTAAVPSIQRSKQTLQGTKGTLVEMNDSIRTAAGKVGIRFEDNTTVQVNENSRLVIDDFVYDPKAKGGKLAVNVASGTVRYASGQIAKNNPQSVAVNTPSATIGVRGTDFTATVDELGASTIILLPSCPPGWRDVERDCKTGSITVDSDAGQVVLTKPFQATRVESRSAIPMRPVILNLSEDAISNMLIISPPKLTKDTTTTRSEIKGALDIDFLKENGLVNVLDAQEKEVYQDKLSRNFLDQDFLANVLDIVNMQLAAQLNMLNSNNNSRLLPDWNALTNITVDLEDPRVTLCRDSSSDIMCVATPQRQNSTVIMTQGSMTFSNRVNNGGGTVITIIQK